MSVDRSQVGADIVKRALSYPLKLIAKNAGVNGSVVSEKVGGYLREIIGVGSCIRITNLMPKPFYMIRCYQATIQNTDTMLQLDSTKISWLLEL